MTILSKTAGALSLTSAIIDIHKTAVISSNREYNKASANAVISNSLGNQKADRISYKDAERKNWLNRNNFTAPIKEAWGRVSGYVKGFVSAAARYIPNFILGAAAILSKNKTIARIATVGLAIVELVDFLKNSTSIFQRTDYLE